MQARSVQTLPLTDDLQLGPGTYYLYFEAQELFTEMVTNPDWETKLEAKITEDTGASVDVTFLPVDAVGQFPSGALVAVRLIIADDGQVATQGVVTTILLGAIVLAIAAVSTRALTLKIREIQKEIVENIPTEVLVNTSRGVYLFGVASLVGVLAVALVVLRR